MNNDESVTISNLTLVERRIAIGGRPVTIRLESLLWEAFDEICRRERMTDAGLCARIVQERGFGALSDSVAAVVAQYFRDAARNTVSIPGVTLAEALNAIGPVLQ